VLIEVILVLAGIYAIASLTYVYKFRGNMRYESINEYLRKGWPIFTPFNCLLYSFTKPEMRTPILKPEEFPGLQDIKNNWETIREEALVLHSAQALEKTSDPNSQSYYDIGFRTFYKYGWKKFYLTWYGHTHASAKRLCPKTVEILNNVPCVNGAMFTVLPVGSKLTRHLDPVACSLRYHLGLSTPNSDDCFINIDGQQYSWRDGEDLVFDETYLHFAKNNSDQDRLILMCDIERPMNFLGKIVNFFYKIVGRMSLVPNMAGDKRGPISFIFSSLAPIFGKSKEIKKTNPLGYKMLKYTVNGTLFLIVVGLLWGIFYGLQSLF
jgi:beta-hydroxylase